MSSEHSSKANEPDKVNSGALAMVLGLVALSTLAVALVVTALVRDEVDKTKDIRDATQENAYRQLKAEQLSELDASPSFIDRAKGVVSIPIDRAMALTLDAIRRNPEKLSPWGPEAMGGAGPEAEAKLPSVPEGTAATQDVATAKSPSENQQTAEKSGAETP